MIAQMISTHGTRITYEDLYYGSTVVPQSEAREDVVPVVPGLLVLEQP